GLGWPRRRSDASPTSAFSGSRSGHQRMVFRAGREGRYSSIQSLHRGENKRIRGAHIVGPSADEVINLFGMTMRLGLPSDKLRHLVPAIHLRQPMSGTCLVESYPESQE